MLRCRDSALIVLRRNFFGGVVYLVALSLSWQFQLGQAFAEGKDNSIPLDKFLALIPKASLNDIGQINGAVEKVYEKESLKLLNDCKENFDKIESYEVELKKRERVNESLKGEELITLGVHREMPNVLWVKMDWKDWGQKASYMNDIGNKDKMSIKNPHDVVFIGGFLPPLEKNVREPLGLLSITDFPIHSRIKFLTNLLESAKARNALRILYLGAKAEKEKELEERKTIRIIAWFDIQKVGYVTGNRKFPFKVSLLLTDLVRERPIGVRELVRFPKMIRSICLVGVVIRKKLDI